MRLIRSTIEKEELNQIEESIEEGLIKIIRKLDLVNFKIDRMQHDITNIKNNINSINFNVFRIRLNSSNILLNSMTMNNELEKLHSLLINFNDLNEYLDQNQMNQIKLMMIDLRYRLGEIENIIQVMPTIKNDKESILKKIAESKPSDSEAILQTIANLLAIFSFLIQVLKIS